MNVKEMRNTAREKMKGFCRVCPECNGVVCAGEVPGMGGTLTGSSFKSNVTDLAKVKVRLKTIHNATNPDTSFDFFGNKLDMPIIGAAVTGTAFNMGPTITEEEYIDSVVSGTVNAGTMTMIGDSVNPVYYDYALNAVKNVNSKGIAIIKPKDNDVVMEFIKKAEDIGAVAAGMDIDGAGLVTMALHGIPVGPKTPEDLKKIISSTKLPFVLKGIMTKEEALLAVEVGAKAIVVSNHGGRVLDHTQSTAKVLPEIAEAVKGKIMILVDGGIRTGVDVLKMIALGADAVSIGRPVAIGAYGGFAEGVEQVFSDMKNQLYQAMILTGAKDLKSIDKSMISIEW
ncbi:MAG: alpha-hydroxy-acid oxidizing protein [Tissierellaceae bacterium]|nr:alpha-hydroxy-acid oxidizing protein [Tissierellaceae bacterium]